MRTLNGLGINTAGAGADIAAARRPAFVESQGRRVALLAYCSTFPVGYEARDGVPGLVPLRVDTLYAPPIPNFWAPGVKPRIATRPWPEDVTAMVEDIARARESADIVVVSMHMGDSSLPLHVHDYERQLAVHAADTGADIVFCHHHHSLRGAEIYQGVPIFYGLGNFAFDLRDFAERLSPETLERFKQVYGEYAFGLRAGFPLFPFHPDYRFTAIGVVEMADRTAVRVGLIPCIVRPDGPEPLPIGHPDRQAVVEYLARATRLLDTPTHVLPAGGGHLAGVEACAVTLNKAP